MAEQLTCNQQVVGSTPIQLQIRLCGYYSKEDTPVPIPNTEVKLLSADGTWWATAWESKT